MQPANEKREGKLSGKDANEVKNTTASSYSDQKKKQIHNLNSWISENMANT